MDFILSEKESTWVLYEIQILQYPLLDYREELSDKKASSVHEGPGEGFIVRSLTLLYKKLFPELEPMTFMA